MPNYIKEMRHQACWKVYGRNKVIILIFSFCGLATILTSYSLLRNQDPVEDGQETYRNIDRGNGQWLIAALSFTFVANIVLSIVHSGEAFYPDRFIRKGRLLTTNWRFRFLEMANGAICSVLILSSTSYLLLMDRALILRCTNTAFCSSTVAAVIFSFATMVATLANLVIGMCETVQDDMHFDLPHRGRDPGKQPLDEDPFLLRTI